MANTYTQLYIQFVFAVNGRKSLIKESFRNELEQLICGIVKKNQCKPYAIYCNPDHTHLFVGMHPTMAPSKLIEYVKCASSSWLNKTSYLPGKFSWQDGYAAFTYSQSHIHRVVQYILNQRKHHQSQSFRDEYQLFLQKFDVKYDDRFLFDNRD
ncbi:MAG: IS200/IS605 family transposase [Chitinophagales bacterium]